MRCCWLTPSPFILVIVDDNMETGFSMREGFAAARDRFQSDLGFTEEQMPPVIGLTLLNLSNSGTKTGGPRRKSWKGSEDTESFGEEEAS